MSKLTCLICGYTHPTMISPTHLKKHGITGAEYKEKFPGAILRIQTEDSKQKMADSKKGKSAWNKGIKTGPNEKLSFAKKGKPNEKLRGLKRSEEQRKNIADGTKAGMTQEVCRHVSEQVKESYKQRRELGIEIAGSMRGKNHSVETKQKLSEIGKRRNFEFRELQIKNNIERASLQNITVLEVEEQYWYDMVCNTCETRFSFTKQIFLPSVRNGENLCPTCFPRQSGRSQLEIDFFNEIKSIYANVVPNDRDVLGGKEIDVLAPSLKVGFEFTGLYWHAEKQTQEKKHLLWKKQYAANKGISLYTVFEDEWLNSRDLVLSRIKSILGIIENKIYARKCTLKLVPSKQKNLFLDENHLQGKDSSSIAIGLYFNDELVSLGTFKKTNMVKGGKGNEWELSRFCSKMNYAVVGAASKIIKEFMGNYAEGLDLISYADSRWSNGDLYRSIGFTFEGLTPPSYWYLQDYKIRKHRSSFMKHKLVKTQEDKLLTEWELAQREGLDRIWDCGTTKWRLTK